MIPLLEKVKNIDLTASEKLLFDYIQEDPKRIIHQNLQDICQKLYISNATIVRFCQKIGYQGFHEFKFAIRSQLEDITENDLSLDSYFNFHLSRFKDAIQLIPFDQLETISKMFHSYSTIYIYGSAMSSIPAHYLYSVLSSLDFSCIYIEWRHLLRGIAENTDANTLMFMITSHGYNERYLDVIETLKNNGSTIIYITDEENHKIEELVHYYINTREPGHYLHNVDFSFKTKTLIFIQILIDLIYNNTINNRQQ
ncbi:MurR/RpiR family transcriptional regulator [Merdibacter massiliensis]|uniref:MurR/RpiR family transcriptional regulator n=1 Tax=Merdibacter massiliensis TaxID=1871030 RepID=UPI00096A9252|nr:MurR/RpiR family transcriptional regulator [Merdibacter massiliensis]